MGFGEAGAVLGGALETYQRQKRIQDFVARQLAKLPPEKQAEAAAILSPPEPAPQALPASSGMDGAADVMPADTVGYNPQQPVNDLFAAPAAPAAAKPAAHDPGVESLRMLLEATRDDVMEPKTLFDYIAGMGKQDMIGTNRMDLERIKEDLRRDLQQNDLQARLDRLERVLSNRKEIADDRNDTSTENNKRNNSTRLTATDRTNSTRKEIADKHGSGKAGKDPDMMTPDEIDAELGVYGARADSLNTAGSDPKAVGYKPAEEKFATIDEANRQKDLSKTEERITALKAAKARKAAGGGGTKVPDAAPPAAGGAKVYTSKADIKAELAAGRIKPGQKVQFKMPDGSTVLVNTGK